MRNAEHYPDPTAMKAINTVRPGEIWTARTPQGTRRVLILAEHDGVATVLYILKGISDTPYRVEVGDNYDAVDVRYLAYVFSSNLEDFTTRIPTKKLDEVRAAIRDAMSITTTADSSPAPISRKAFTV